MLWWTLRQLKADDWRARQSAADKLGELKDSRAIDPLITILKDRNPNVRQSAQHALVKIGAPSVHPLVTSLKSRNAEVRDAALSALVKIGPPAVAALGLALHDRELAVREAASLALSRIRDETALEQLVSALRLGDFGSKEASAAGLVRIGQPALKPLVAALKDNKPRVRETAAAALVRLGSIAIEPLVGALQDPELREAASEALTQIDPNWAKTQAARASVPALSDLVRRGDEKVRQAATASLGEIGEPMALHSLLAALQDENEDVQAAAVQSLGQLGDARGLKPLMQILASDLPKSRNASSAALIQMGCALVEPMVLALKNRNAAVREAAAKVLVRVGHAIIEPLATALWEIDPDWAHPQTQAGTVPQFVAAVNPALASKPRPGEPHRPVAARTVLKSAPSAGKDHPLPFVVAGNSENKVPRDIAGLAQALASRDAQVRAAALKNLWQIGATNEEPLIGALKHDNYTIRRAAAHALAEEGDVRARDVLRADLKDNSGFVVLDAVESLVKIQEVTVVQPLVKLLSDIGGGTAPPDGAKLHNVQRAARLLCQLLQSRAKDLLQEDLQAIVKLQIPNETKFASPLAGGDPDSSGAFQTAAEPFLDLSEIRKAAQRELNRRALQQR